MTICCQDRIDHFFLSFVFLAIQLLSGGIPAWLFYTKVSSLFLLCQVNVAAGVSYGCAAAEVMDKEMISEA